MRCEARSRATAVRYASVRPGFQELARSLLLARVVSDHQPTPTAQLASRSDTLLHQPILTTEQPPDQYR